VVRCLPEHRFSGAARAAIRYAVDSVEPMPRRTEGEAARQDRYGCRHFRQAHLARLEVDYDRCIWEVTTVTIYAAISRGEANNLIELYNGRL
jgi:hypothetical protein